ncbi:hypothetical protein M0208_03695 [Sphingomonas sp. SUN019]|uniref:hypothetical protein n=1 Tax=Sphingomonas sp. SUN019 TaxID=2937788 RepID=UPI002164C395|nr:hypothetical protein [Sphingomonas sp. SUN019]UVO49655.1 hypothetical protein M0208_03695 [Sphingomonas sp. SUN019]
MHNTANSVSEVTVSGTFHIRIPKSPDHPPIIPVVQAGAVGTQSTGQLSDEDMAAFRSNVEEMLDASGPGTNVNERLVNVITACICEGIDTAGWIIAVARTFGFKRGHVGSVLTYSAAGRSKTPLWRCNSDGHYSLLD